MRLVRVQWWERVPAYLVIDPTNPDNILMLGKEEFEALSQKAKLAGGSSSSWASGESSAARRAKPGSAYAWRRTTEASSRRLPIWRLRSA
jgi:hypothetical protein